MSVSTSIVLLTGDSGYLSVHVALAWRAQCYRILVLNAQILAQDSLADIGLLAEWVAGKVHDYYWLSQIFSTHSIDAVVNFTVDSSNPVTPQDYYNRVAGPLTLLEAMLSAGVNGDLLPASLSG